VPGTIKAETSESALNDFKVRNVVQKVGRPRSVWVAALLRTRMSSAVGAMRAIEAALLAPHGNHILNAICRSIDSLRRAHLRWGLLCELWLNNLRLGAFLMTTLPFSFSSHFITL